MRILLLGLSLISALAMAAAPASADTKPLRVCADPDNLPFTKDHPVQKGFYLDVADALANAMGARVEVYWWRNFYGKRALRSTLLADRCDLFFGLPHEADLFGPRIIYSRPILDLSYAIVVPSGQTVSSLDQLKAKKVGVQFNSPPQNLLASLDGFETATFLEAEEAMAALAEGKIDAAFLWGPSAGFYNKEKLNGRFQVIPTAGQSMDWKAAIGFAREDKALREAIDKQLEAITPIISQLMDKYGFPQTSPIRLAATKSVAPLPAEASHAEVRHPGQAEFNNVCGHCHGPNGQAAERRVDLRRLRLKYGPETDTIYQRTVLEGRVAKGMPAWKEIISAEEISVIKSYVETLQQK